MMNNHLKVIKATFFETGTSPDMVSHSMTTQIDPGAYNLFSERTREGQILSQEVLAGLAGQIIRPDANAERQIHLPNGAQNVRYRFLFVVGNPEALNSSMYYYSGYTDIVGFSMASKNFDPHMRLYFNNVVVVNQVMKPGPNGPVPQVNVIECNHLIHPATLGADAQMFATTFNPQGGFGVANQPTSLRPTDLMLHLSSKNKAHQMGATMGQQFVDSRTAIDLCKSNRTNTVPSYYLNKTAEGLLYGMNTAAHNPESGPHSPYDSAVGRVEENNVFADRFFSLLAHDYGYHQNGFITWSDMCRAHNELLAQGVTYMVNRAQAQQQDIFISNRGDYDTMVGDRRPQTMLVNQIMQSLPGTLISSLMSFARVHVTNMNPGGQLMVTITDPMSYVNLGSQYLISKIPYLEQRLQSIVFSDIGFNQYIPFDAWFTIDVFGESYVRIAFNGDPNYTPYSFASYCDAMSSMIVSTNGQALGKISNDLDFLIKQTCAF